MSPRLSLRPLDGVRRFLVFVACGGVVALPGLSSAWADEPDVWTRDTLTGDWGGLRSTLDEAGLKLGGVYTGEALGNPSGGLRQRGVAEGLLEIDIDADFEKLAGWRGLTFHSSLFQIHGRSMSANFLSNNFTVRDIEAAPAGRVWAMWLQQSFYDDLASLRIGQMPEQEEFCVSANGAYFINGTFGWPIGFAANMPSGGGAYPLAMTGARLKVQPTDSLTALLAVFNGDPAPSSLGSDPDPQRRNRYGLNFDTNQPPHWFGELQYGLNQGSDAVGLPAMLKLGGWYHTGRFQDLRDDTTGLSLSSPDSTGIAKTYRGSWGVYGVVDQTVWRKPGTPDGGISVFSRLSLSPEDRSAMPYYGEVGLTWKGMVEDRDDDVAGLAVAYGKMSPALSARDRDALSLGGRATAIRDYEMVIEALYRAQMTPWLTMVPNVQYIAHPGGGIGSPDAPATRIPDATVLGLRAVLKL